MVAWRQVQVDAPDFAARVQERFDAGTNKTMATIRADGSPRISGTELRFRDGRITLGMMPNSRKLFDVLRDPRVALHSPTLEPPPGPPSLWAGDAKVSGRLVGIDPIEGEPADGVFFEVDLDEAVLTYVDDTNIRLVIESWHTERGWTRHTRT